MSAHVSPKYINVHSVAAMFGVSVSAIWRWTRGKNNFPKAYKLGNGSTRCPVEDLNHYDQQIRAGAFNSDGSIVNDNVFDPNDDDGGSYDGGTSRSQSSPAQSSRAQLTKPAARRSLALNGDQKGLPFGSDGIR